MVLILTSQGNAWRFHSGDSSRQLRTITVGRSALVTGTAEAVEELGKGSGDATEVCGGTPITGGSSAAEKSASP